MNDQNEERLIQQLERISLAIEIFAENIIQQWTRISLALETITQLQLKAAEEEEDIFEAEELVPEMLDGEIYWKVKGGRFKKHGVRVWPEVLEEAGFKDLEIKKVQLEPGWMAQYMRNEETGKIKKVIRLERAIALPKAEGQPAKEPAPARKPTPDSTATGVHGKTGPSGLKPLAWTEFEAQATGWKLHPSAAARIAALHGLEPKSADLSRAAPTLRYFGKAKKLGLDWAASLAILQESVMDPEKASRVLDEQHTPPGKAAD